MRKDQGVYKQVAVTLSKHFDGIYFVDIDTGDYTEVVPIGILQELGLPSSGKDFFKDAVKCAKKCVHPDDAEACSKAVNEVLNKEGKVSHFYYRAKKADGTYVLLTTRGFVLFDKDGKPEYFGGIIIVANDKA